jgi:hypothetical protein
MSLTWLAPAAWWLAALAAVPIAMHLLARHRRQPLRFPTVRFLEDVPAATRRRWQVDEPVLLAVRVLVVLAVAAALAAPVLVTPARQARWDAPLARAIVATPALAESAAAAVPAVEGDTRRFVTDDVPAGVADAAAWLAPHRLSRREIVIVAPLTRGTLDADDVRAVPADIGVRVVRAGLPPTGSGPRVRMQLVDDTLWRIRETVSLDDSGTTVRETARAVSSSRVIEPVAAPADAAAAEAARRAVLRRGVVLDVTNEAPLRVPWTGEITTFAAAVDAHRGDGLGRDPAPISAAALEAMTRPPAPRGPSAPHDEGDRRVAWLLVLVLLGVETWWRRRPA